MAKIQYVRASANNPVIRVFIQDSSKTDGSGLGSVAFDSTGLKIAVMRELDSSMTVYTSAGSTTETIATLGTYAAPTATKCRIKLVDGTNAVGLVELQFAQALFGTGDGSRFLTGIITGVTNMAPCLFEIQLQSDDPQVAKPANFASTVISAAGLSLTNAIIKNTAFNNYGFVMTSNGKAKAGLLTVTPTRSLDGAAFGACANSVSEIASGAYKINLANTDLNANCVILKFSATGADDTIIVHFPQQTV